MNQLEQRIMDISRRHRLSHLGSCFTALPIIAGIYEKMQPTDRFVLSNGHAALALYVVLEHHGKADAEELVTRHGIHPERDIDCGIFVSTGSLGMGLPIAVGMAYANRGADVYCLISDGECAEGSIWEALQFIDDHQLINLKVHVNMNGVAAYKAVNIPSLTRRLTTFLPTITIHYTNVHDVVQFDSDLQAHYKPANQL
jgi:transketolase